MKRPKKIGMLFLACTAMISMAACASEKKEEAGVQTEAPSSAKTSAAEETTPQEGSEKAVAEEAKSEGETSEKTAAEGAAEIPEHYAATVNDVVFDAEVEVTGEIGDGLLTGTAALEKPDAAKAQELLAAGKTVKEESTDSVDINGETVDIHYIWFEDGGSLNIDTMLSYSTPLFESIHNAFRLEETADYNADKYSKDGSFAFKSPEDAFQAVMDMVNDLGYTISDADYSYYALDAATMQQEEIVTDQSGQVVDAAGRSWSENDDCYYFYIEQTYDGIPIYGGTEMFMDDYEGSRPIEAVYSKDGIQSLKVGDIYKITPSEERVQLKDFESIAKVIADKYGNILTGTTYQVKRAKLYQKAIQDISGSYEIRPVWLFEILESGTDSETGEYFETTLFTLVDAQTGEEVAV